MAAQDLMLLSDYGEDYAEVTVRRNGIITRLEDLEPHDREFVNHMEKYDAWKLAEEHAGEVAVDDVRHKTSEDMFNDYCKEENIKEVKRVLALKNITVSSSGDDYDEEGSGSGDDESPSFPPIVDVRDQKSEDELNKSLKNLELLARLGDHSLLSEKLDVEDGTEFEAVESLVNTFNMAANGKIERVVKIDSKKGVPTLLIQFDSTEYRDAVLRSSRSPDARYEKQTYLRVNRNFFF